MNLFFGKISKLFDINQIHEGYYMAPKDSSWFGDLNLGDYVYLIGGDKIQFWQAKEWGTKDGKECLYFDILNNDIGITVSNLIGLKFLKLTKSLLILTSRSAKNKAFFNLEMLEDISIPNLSNSEFYANQNLYRNIKIIDIELVEKNSKDIQLTYENEELKLVDNDFMQKSIIGQFKDNLSYYGKGAKMKDKVLDYFSNAINSIPVTINSNDIGLRSFYDTFFCEYKESKKYFLVGAFWDTSNPQDQTSRFIKESNWINGYEDKFIEEVKKVPVGSEIAIKAAFVREKTKSVMTIKARGIVVNNHEDGRTLDVEWEEDFLPFEVPFGGYMSTIKEVTKLNHIEEIWLNNKGQLDNTKNKNTNNMKSTLNQILYGPPGTGKTYNSINKAIEIINPTFDLTQDRKIVKDEFDRLVGLGQIAFTTFHQSMSYEDFIEGIKPKVEEDINENKQVVYEIEDGIFKRLANKAKTTNTSINSNTLQYSFDDAWDDLITEAEQNIERGIPETLKIQTPNLGLKIVEITERGNLRLKPIYSEDAREYTVSYSRVKRLHEVFPDLSKVKNIDKEFRAVIGGSNSTAYWSILNILNPKIIANSNNINSTKESPSTPFVLIIDEINRGNISSIFGELITLIEDSKRLGQMEELEVILPYSKTKFGVPSNLYIIGTMNTADRSVEALDTALRRRFSFVEMMPDEKVISDKKFTGYDRATIMNLINQRIEVLLDRNYTLGHSYFIKDDFQNSFENEIIPLLQEYFYNDYGKIGLVLGRGFVREKAITAKNDKSIFADFDTKNEVDITKSYELIPFAEIDFETAIQTLLA